MNIGRVWPKLLVASAVALATIGCGDGDGDGDVEANGAETDSEAEDAGATSDGDPGEGDGSESAQDLAGTTINLILPDGAVTRAFEPMLADFTSSTGIEVDTGSYSNDELRQQQLLDLSSGTGSLDVIMLQHSWLPEMYTNLESLDSYFASDADADVDTFLPSMIEFSQRDGSMYMAPVRSFGEVLMYRTDLFEEAGIQDPPRTTDEFLTAVEALTTDDHFGYVAQNSQTLFGVVEWTLWLRSFGGNILNEEATEPVFNSSEGIAATEFVVDLYQSGYQDPGSIEFENEGVISALQQGRAAMGSTNFPTFAEIDNPDVSEHAGNFAIAPYLPYAPESGLDAGVTNIGGWGFGINAHSDNKDAAWELVKFASSADVQERLAVEYGNAPTVTSVYDSPAYQEVFTEGEAVSQVLANGQYFPTIPEWPQIQDSLALAITRALVGDMSAEDALSAAEEEVRQILGSSGG